MSSTVVCGAKMYQKIENARNEEQIKLFGKDAVKSKKFHNIEAN